MLEGNRHEPDKCSCEEKRKKWRIGGEEITGCPERLFTGEVMTAIRLWEDWKMFGFMYSGGSAEQPARYLEILRLLEYEKLALENKRAVQMKEKMESGVRHAKPRRHIR